MGTYISNLKHRFYLKIVFVQTYETNVMLIKSSQHCSCVYLSVYLFKNKPSGPHEVDFVTENGMD